MVQRDVWTVQRDVWMVQRHVSKVKEDDVSTVQEGGVSTVQEVDVSTVQCDVSTDQEGFITGPVWYISRGRNIMNGAAWTAQGSTAQVGISTVQDESQMVQEYLYDETKWRLIVVPSVRNV